MLLLKCDPARLSPEQRRQIAKIQRAIRKLWT
jgi:hypothetical protein